MRAQFTSVGSIVPLSLARHVSVQVAAKIAKIRRIRLREIAPVNSTPLLPLRTFR